MYCTSTNVGSMSRVSSISRGEYQRWYLVKFWDCSVGTVITRSKCCGARRIALTVKDRGLKRDGGGHAAGAGRRARRGSGRHDGQRDAGGHGEHVVG